MTSVHMPLYTSLDNGGLKDVVRPDVARPSTPSFRIVTTPALNPSPTFTEVFEEEEVLFEDVLSPKKLGVAVEEGASVIPSGQDLEDELDAFLYADKPLVFLRQLSGFSDLSQVVSLDLIVDTSDSSLGSLGNYLPNIRELRLSGSRITSVRDLGTTLRSLQVLWMSRCGLEDLDGIASIGKLKELYLSYNDISDVSPLSMVDTLELVDMESNNVQTLDQVEFLCMCPQLKTLSIEGNPLTANMSPLELRAKVSKLIPNLMYLDDQLLGGQVSELSTSSHKLLGNTGNLQSEIRVVNTSLRDTISDVMRRPRSARSEDSRDTPSPTQPNVLHDNHCSDLTQGTVACGPPSKLRNKVTRNVKESEPPKLVGAWSEDADDMVKEWQASRDWLTRELTVDSMNEEKMKTEKQANYEAALRDVSRPSTAGRKLSRPTSSQNSPISPGRREPESPSQQSHVSSIPASPSGADRTNRQNAGSSSKQIPNRSNQTPTYDESIEVEEQYWGGPRNSRDHSHEASNRRSDGSQKVARKPRDGSRDNVRKPRDGSSDTGRKPRGSSRDTERNSRDGSRGKSTKGKEKLARTNSTSSSAEFSKRRTTEVNSPTSLSLDSRTNTTSPLRGVISPYSDKMALPTPPTAGKSMSTRFRRLKVSIEDQVAQQSAVDVLFSDRMPKPGLSRHTVAVPKPGDCG